jgi:cyclic di-GMP phosphodiesterase
VMAQEIAMTHHEWINGCGYPRGLKGEEIPLAGRIVALADVYDALTSKRVYKPLFSHEKARTIILEGAGTQFDPDVVQAFVNRESDFILIREKLQDQSPLQTIATEPPIDGAFSSPPLAAYPLGGSLCSPSIAGSLRPCPA